MNWETELQTAALLYQKIDRVHKRLDREDERWTAHADVWPNLPEGVRHLYQQLWVKAVRDRRGRLEVGAARARWHRKVEDFNIRTMQ